MAEDRKTRLEILTLRVNLATRIALVALVVAVIAWPGLFVERVAGALDPLGRAGVEEIALFGVKLRIPRDEAATVNAEIAELADQLALLEGRNAALATLLRCQAAGTCDDAERAELAAILGAGGAAPVAVADPRLAEIGRQLGAALAETDRLAAAAAPQAEAQAQAGERYVIVVGADKTAESARHELRALTRAGFAGGIVQRGSWLRTYAAFDSRSAAEGARDALATAMGRDVTQVFEFSTWCPSPAGARDAIPVCA